jgi:hypothetical protein
MMAALNSVYIAQAQRVQTLWNALQLLCENIASLTPLITNSGAQTAWNAMATAVQTATGAIGTPDVTGGSGTASVTQNSPIVTFSASQTGLAGTYVVFLGDSTGGQYLMAGGSGVTWQLVTPYLGPTLTTAFWATITPNNSHVITVGNLNMSANDLATAITDLGTVLAVMNGTSGTVVTKNRLADAPTLTTLTN